MNGACCSRILPVQTVGNRGMIPVRKSNVPRNTVYMSRSDYTDMQFHDTYPHNVIHDTERNLSFVFLSRLLEL